MTHPFWTYTSQVLGFRLGEDAPGMAAGVDGLDRKRVQAMRAASRPGVSGVIVLGLGTGDLARDVAGLAGPDLPVALVELEPARARRLIETGGLSFLGEDAPVQLIADVSSQAALFLLRLAGNLGPSPLVLLNPELSPAEKGAYQGLRKLLFGRVMTAAAPAAPGDNRTLGVIASPGEPELAAFFADVAGLAHDLAVVWDAPEPPGVPVAFPGPIYQLARELKGDFAAQRNAMMDACPGPVVLSLDVDERADAGLRRGLPALAGFAGYGGAYLPRLTLNESGERVLCGYGLWPDLQLRLYRKVPGARYVLPVHERLEGLAEPLAIAPAASIVHESRVLKSRGDIVRKLAGFDAASGGRVSHRLAEEYPSLPRAFFEELTRGLAPETLWLAGSGESGRGVGEGEAGGRLSS